MVFIVCSVKRKYNVTISTGKEYLVFVHSYVYDAVGNGDGDHVADTFNPKLEKVAIANALQTFKVKGSKVKVTA